MGSRIVFFTAHNKKSLLENFTALYADFRNWTLNNWNTSESQSDGELALGQQITLPAVQFLNDFESLPTQPPSIIIDELITIFLCSYCSHGPGNKLCELRGPMMRTWRYIKSTKLINKKCDDAIVTLWNRLNYGCSSNTDLNKSQTKTKDLVVGWWSVDEMKTLETQLVQAYDTINQFNYLNAARKNGALIGNDNFEGLSYAYDTFDIGLSEQKEIVFYHELN